MAGHNPPQSPTVNNLISFWSDLESPSASSNSVEAQILSRSRGPQPVASQASSPHLLPSSSRPGRQNPPSSSSSTPPVVNHPRPPRQSSAPLFPLRSVAPVQSRVFGTQRHALDTINLQGNTNTAAAIAAARASASRSSSRLPIAPTLSPSPIRNPAPRAAHHVRPPPLQSDSPHSQGQAGDIGRGAAHVPSSSSRDQSRAVPKRMESTCVPSDRRNSQSDAAQPTRAALPALPPVSRSSNEGILKLSVIPPAASKEETLKHHQHLARSHPMASSSEPLGRPIDALLPLGTLSASLHNAHAVLKKGYK